MRKCPCCPNLFASFLRDFPTNNFKFPNRFSRGGGNPGEVEMPPKAPSHFPSCCGAGVTNLNEPPSIFLLPPHYCGLGAGSIPFRAIENNKQCETRELFMSLVIRYGIGDVQDCQGVTASEMTDIVSGGALNFTRSLTHSLTPGGEGVITVPISKLYS